MRGRLWLAQPNNGRRLDALLRGMVAWCVLWSAAAGYGLFHFRAALRTMREDTGTHFRQAEEMTRSLRQKQATAAQAVEVHTDAPDSAGAAAWGDSLSQMAHDANVALEALKMTAEEHPKTPPAPIAANGANAANPNGGSANPPPNASPAANGQAAPAVAKNPDEGWNKAKFECSAVGTYRTLTDFMRRLTDAPYVMEIAEAEMTRSKYDTKSGVAILRLKLTLTLYGLPKKP